MTTYFPCSRKKNRVIRRHINVCLECERECKVHAVIDGFIRDLRQLKVMLKMINHTNLLVIGALPQAPLFERGMNEQISH
jgi:hypothetical protein